MGESVLAAGGAMLECVHVVAREELSLPAGIFRAQDPLTLHLNEAF